MSVMILRHLSNGENEQRGMLAASKRPSKNLVTKSEALPLAAAIQAAEVPQQKTLTVIRILGLTRTIK